MNTLDQWNKDPRKKEMYKPQPNFNHPNFFIHFRFFPELVLYSTILRISEYEDKFVHTRKTRQLLASLLKVSEIHIKVHLRHMAARKIFRKGKRGIYWYNKELIR